MSYHPPNGGGTGGGGSGGGVAENSSSLRGIAGEYSGDDRDSRSDGEERPDFDTHGKPVYLLEHLATFTVNKESGIVYPADGMRRLLQLEKTTGIWSQKMQLCLDYQWVLIMDYETGNVIERFPATLIQEPTAFTSTDAMELYNNILVFIVSGGSGSRSEMHIFQSQSVSAVDLVEDLKNLRVGKLITHQRKMTQQQQKLPSSSLTKSMVTTTMYNRPDSHHNHQHQHHYHMHGGRTSKVDHYAMRGGGSTDIGGHTGEADSEHGVANDETSSTSSDKYERDVNVLNHCFDDIEKFIARLQHAAAASRELERRRRNRKTKKKDPGEGLLTLRTRPPHEKEFIDIFAKFKLSFNLLAKLKAHIHDPNAPELVHFLFTPLALIVEASSDTFYESQLPARVINPLLTREAINLLINCVTSKETELWRSLGDAWTIPRDLWKENVGSYHPVFLDGWSPDYLVIEELESTATPTNINKRRLDVAQIQHDAGIGMNGRGGGASGVAHRSGYDVYESDKYAMHHREHGVPGFSTRSDISMDSIERSGMGAKPADNVPTGGAIAQNVAVMQSITSGIQKLHAREPKNIVSSGGTESELATANVNMGEDQLLEQWLDELQAADAKIVLVTYPRTANNDKELSVVRGEYLEILDDTRKWWKARNIRGQTAHVPHTIVTPYNYNDTDTGPQQPQPNAYKAKHSSNTNATENTEQQVVDSAEWIRNKHLGKKGEFRYF